MPRPTKPSKLPAKKKRKPPTKITQEMEDQIYHLRAKEALSFRAISRALDIDVMSVANHYRTYMANLLPVEEVRAQHAQENDRLDDLWHRAYQRLKQADNDDTFFKALTSLDRIHRSRVALNGLEAPKQIHLTVEETPPLDRITEALDRFIIDIGADQT